jgi:NAD(P)H-hydrate epimerase
MVPLYSTLQIRDLDNFAINEAGIPGILLMENAALNISDVITDKLTESGRGHNIGIICGKGNNGGDGLAAARHLLNAGYTITIIMLGKQSELSSDSSQNYNILKRLNNPDVTFINYTGIKDLKCFNKCDTIIDAILGSGAKGELKEPLTSIIRELNKLNSYKIAIDIPTGLDADKGYGKLIFNSDLTITLAGYKRGLFINDGYNCSGEIVLKGIGIDNRILENMHTTDYLIEPEDALALLPVKGKDLYKYSAGKVLTIAGSVNLPGASVLTSKAALNIGAGASILAFPKVGRNLVAPVLNEVILQPYGESEEFLTPGHIKSLQVKINWADVVAIGPGLGRDEKTQEAVIKILKDNPDKKFVLDADALFALANGNYRKVNLKNSILTPHLAEFAHISGIEINELKKDLLLYGSQFSMETASILILKGARTIIFNPDGEAFINSAGNSGMAKFGTGDVLTGVIAGLYAQIKNSEDSSICGVYLHSLTADLLKERMTEFSYNAGDIIDYLFESIIFLRDSIV